MLADQAKPPEKRIVWISSLILDIEFHKTSRIEVLRALANRGHKVFLIGSYSSDKNFHEFSDLNLILVPARHAPLFSMLSYVLAISLYLPFLLLRLKPDIVIVEPEAGILSLLPVLTFPKSIRPKIVLDIRTTPVGYFNMNRRLRTIFFNISVKWAKKFFQGMTIITHLMKKEVCEKYDIDPRFIGVWTSGVSTSAFGPDKYDGNVMRERLSLTGKFVVFYHGALDGPRGIPEAVKAIGILRHMYPDIVLFLLARKEAFDPKLIQELGVQNKIMLHDRVDYSEVPRYISMCDVGIVPLPNLSDWRNQCPLNLLEYLAMKKVVIATDIPANREVLGANKCGIYASSADPEEIAKAIAYAYNNRKMLGEWSEYGRAIVEEKYSWEKVGEDLENYLRGL